MDLVMRISLFVLPLALWLLTGCDVANQMAESSAHATPIEAEIEQAVGKKPDVFSAGSGPILMVTVQFSEVPAVSVPALEAISRTAIVHEFKREPTSLTLSFVYNKWRLEQN